jgi:RNA polymerase sigma-70 factor (ECF subfamily)
MSNSEHELIRRVVAGERSAFTGLVEKYEGPISYAIFRIVGDRDQAADITQQAFLSAFEHLSTFDTRHRFFSWLYRIAWNDAINYCHHRKNNKPLGHFDLPSSDPSPVDRLMTKEQNIIIDRAIGALEFKYRVVVVLRHFLDLSYAEIGGIIELPVSTVRSRIHTARALLREGMMSDLVEVA